MLVRRPFPSHIGTVHYHFIAGASVMDGMFCVNSHNFRPFMSGMRITGPMYLI